METPNFPLIATKVGDLLKNSTSVNEIDRIAKSILKIDYDKFPNDSITSMRASKIYNWIMSLAKYRMDPDQKIRLLVQFCSEIASADQSSYINDILRNSGIPQWAFSQLTEDYEFDARNYHSEIMLHCKDLFNQGNYFHAVFEGAKVFNSRVKEKSKSNEDGYSLMMEVWDPNKGVLKITACVTETDKNIQEGMKFLSAGLMKAIRNPTAHEPALEWPIEKSDALNILGFLSFLFKELDKATYFKQNSK